MEHLSRERLVAGLGQIRDSPQDGGRLVLIVRRPAPGERSLPAEAVLDQAINELLPQKYMEHAGRIG